MMRETKWWVTLRVRQANRYDPGITIECESPEAAVELAAQLRSGQGVEVIAYAPRYAVNGEITQEERIL